MRYRSWVAQSQGSNLIRPGMQPAVGYTPLSDDKPARHISTNPIYMSDYSQQPPLRSVLGTPIRSSKQSVVSAFIPSLKPPQPTSTPVAPVTSQDTTTVQRPLIDEENLLSELLPLSDSNDPLMLETAAGVTKQIQPKVSRIRYYEYITESTIVSLGAFYIV